MKTMKSKAQMNSNSIYKRSARERKKERERERSLIYIFVRLNRREKEKANNLSGNQRWHKASLIRRKEALVTK